MGTALQEGVAADESSEVHSRAFGWHEGTATEAITATATAAVRGVENVAPAPGGLQDSRGQVAKRVRNPDRAACPPLPGQAQGEASPLGRALDAVLVSGLQLHNPVDVIAVLQEKRHLQSGMQFCLGFVARLFGKLLLLLWSLQICISLPKSGPCKRG